MKKDKDRRPTTIEKTAAAIGALANSLATVCEGELSRISKKRTNIASSFCQERPKSELTIPNKKLGKQESNSTPRIGNNPFRQ